MSEATSVDLVPTIDPIASERWSQLNHPETPWLHEEIGRRMEDRLQWIRLQPKQWVDWAPVNGGLRTHAAVRARYPKALGYRARTAAWVRNPPLTGAQSTHCLGCKRIHCNRSSMRLPISSCNHGVSGWFNCDQRSLAIGSMVGTRSTEVATSVDLVPTIDPIASERWSQLNHPETPWLHEEIGRRMEDRLQWIRLQPKQWVDWAPVNGGLRTHAAVRARYPKALGYRARTAAWVRNPPLTGAQSTHCLGCKRIHCNRSSMRLPISSCNHGVSGWFNCDQRSLAIGSMVGTRSTEVASDMASQYRFHV